MPAPPVPPEIERLGEDALLLRFGSAIDAATNARVHAAAHRLASARPPWLLDIVPAYSSLALFVDLAAFPSSAEPLAVATHWLRAQHLDGERVGVESRLIEIPVHYGGDDGPDLDDVAAHARLSADEVVARHAALECTVAMLGFAPGFPYLLGMDPALATPRLQTPRTRVAAGSIGIGGAQTGIYPRPGPGGWRIIGRTDLVLFDPRREPVSLLAPGDRVHFVPVVRQRASSSP